MSKLNLKHYPKLKFKINKTLDKKMSLLFWDRKTAGIDFGVSILKDHPSFKKLNKLNVEEKISFINKYVDNYYSKYRQVLNRFLKKFKKEWQSVENQFYLETNKIFKNHPWPKGLYICYLSIFNCNPRFLENKTFQAFYRHSYGIKLVACHEMLHFIFYDYLEKKFAKEIKKISAEKIWTLSEVFNNIILATPEFIKLTQKKPLGYPTHLKLIQKLSLLWAKTNKIEPFLKKVLTRLSSMSTKF